MKPAKAGSKISETVGKIGRKNVKSVRVSIVEKIPNYLNPRRSGGIKLRSNARKVVPSRRTLDEMPPESVARSLDSQFGEPCVIAQGEHIVARRRHHINTFAVESPVRRTFKSGHQIALERDGSHCFILFRCRNCRRIAPRQFVHDQLHLFYLLSKLAADDCQVEHRRLLSDMIHNATTTNERLADLVSHTKLLLIDRMPLAARAVNDWLRDHGLFVVNVSNLDEAIEVLTDFTTGAWVDVVVLQISISEASILDVRDRIRFSCEWERVEVVTFSRMAGGTPEQLEKIFALPAPIPASVRIPSAQLPRSA